MNATKRKFNTLLNGIGNKSTTSLASKEVNNTDEDSQTKRRRVSDNFSINSIEMPSLSTRRSLEAIKKRKLVTSVLPAPEPPKFAPWDRDAFLQRLKSFSNITDWTPKPARVNEVEWSKRGWVCQKQERVRCCLCNVEILVKLNRKEVDGKEEPVYVADRIEAALVDKYVELIITSHTEGCLWRNRGCDDTIFKLPLNNTETTFGNLRERYNELAERSENVPYDFNMRAPANFDLDTVISTLPPDLFSNLSQDRAVQPAEINKVALLMALFGWQGHTHVKMGIQMGSVSCQACFRVLGLWIFKSKQVNEAGEEITGAPMSYLDVVREHRDYCPWQNAVSQNGSGPTKTSTTGMAGWQIILRILHNDKLLRSRRDSPNHTRTPPKSSAGTDSISGFDGTDDADAISIRDEEDKKRFARLRSFKSLLFDTKGGKKIQREKSVKSVKEKSLET